MKPKAILKITLDVIMTLALLFLMGYQFWGDAPHEWVGSGMFVLFLIHHLLNGSWHKNLLRGKYTPMRVLMLCIDVLVFIALILEMYSGIVVSRYVFSFVKIKGGMMLACLLYTSIYRKVRSNRQKFFQKAWILTITHYPQKI